MPTNRQDCHPFSGDGTYDSVDEERRYRVPVRGSQETGCPNGWKESLNGKNWELTTWFRAVCWRNLAEVVNQDLEKGSQVFVEGELRGDANGGSQNPCIWQGKDQARSPGQHRASYEVTARTIKFLSKREGNGAVLLGGLPLQGYEDDDALPF